jgi:hypothetical protein
MYELHVRHTLTSYTDVKTPVSWSTHTATRALLTPALGLRSGPVNFEVLMLRNEVEMSDSHGLYRHTTKHFTCVTSLMSFDQYRVVEIGTFRTKEVFWELRY